MNKKLKKIFLLLPSISLIYSCFTPISGNYGQLYFRAKFPEKNFNIKVIPKETQKIKITIVHGGAENKTRNFELTPDNPTLFIESIEEGNKDVKAEALDLNNNIIASARKDIVIKPLIRNILELELIPGNSGNTAEKPEESPSPSVTTSPSSTSTPGSSGNSPGIPDSSTSIPPSSATPTPTPTPTPSPADTGSSTVITSPSSPVQVEVSIKPDEIGVK